jgi:hypothetical protein
MSRFAERKKCAYYNICNFWKTYGTRLQEENRHGTFKNDIVVKMGQLHQYILDKDPNIHMGILEILGEQKMYLIQFTHCLDAFNDYLCMLRLLDVMFRHNM